MLYPHSGRHGFESIQPDATVPTPPKEIVCAMLKRETEIRNAMATQQQLDDLNRSGRGDDVVGGVGGNVVDGWWGKFRKRKRQ